MTEKKTLSAIKKLISGKNKDQAAKEILILLKRQSSS
jgi:hypothetical protein